MNRGHLSRRERKARIRYIQCHHYNHEEQQFVDGLVYSYGLTYVELWKDWKAALEQRGGADG